MTSSRVLAVDLGATSVRVASVDLAADEPTVEVLHRWHHEPIHDSQGALRWDWGGIVSHVEHGLALGIDTGTVTSIGIDGWGVDYGLLDESGEMVDLPFAYRDPRTESWHLTADRIGIDRLYEISGVQLMGINTIFQLAADRSDRISSARSILLLPDLLSNHLTGWVGCELSNMSTTGLMDARVREWSDDLIGALGLRRDLFPEAARAGTTVGSWRDIEVTLVGSHDTASAFLGVPEGAESDSVFVSAGSWVIVGVERADADTSPRARELNFSNEAGALGGVRFLKNVVGFWILEQCRTEWGDPSLEELIDEASSVEETVPIFDASDHRFVSTANMVDEVISAARLSARTARPVIARSIIESIVEGVVRVIAEIADVTGSKRRKVVLVGGGTRIPLVAELLSQRSGLDVVVGSPEATALGNAIVQGIATGVFSDLAEARQWLAPTGVSV